MTSVPARVLVVEDDESLRFTLEHNLKREGYKVISAARGDDALASARETPPDVVILDLMLPGVDGIQVCRMLRRRTSVPIIMLTALGGEGDKVAGLDAGADDYMPKPFGMRELLARVRVQLRRGQSDAQSASQPDAQRLVSGNLVLDLGRREATLDGEPIRMKPREFELLSFLIRNKGNVLTRNQLIHGVWGTGFDGMSRTVDVHIRWLRRKIEPDAANPTRIRTIRGVGYRFEG